MSVHDERAMEAVMPSPGTTQQPPPPPSSTALTIAPPRDSEEYKNTERARQAYQQGDVEASRREHEKQRMDAHKEPHGGSSGDYVKCIVFGGLDGIMTCFAVVTAAAGGNQDWKTVLVFGFANVLGDAFSMGFSEFVSGKAEMDYAASERKREEWEVANALEMENAEMVDLYEKKGILKEDAIRMVNILAKDPKIFVDFMMVDELQILAESDDPWLHVKSGIVMFVSFVIFGILPLFAYFGGHGQGTDYVFGISCGITAVGLLALGALKGKLSSTNIWLSSLLMLGSGSVSGGVSYGVGALVQYAIG